MTLVLSGLSLAQMEALDVVAIAEILRMKHGGEFPRARISKRTEHRYRWALTVHSASARILERRRLVRIRFHIQTNTASVVLTEAGRDLLRRRWSLIEGYAADVETASDSVNKERT